MAKFIDLTGQRFGRLTVIERAKNTKNNKAQWLCECDCGNKKVVSAANLKNGGTISCGCRSKEAKFIKHGKSNDRLYKRWTAIKRRCYDKRCVNYKNYGGRGIKVCDEWLNSFQSFYDWSVANGFADSLTLDRIDVNGNYEPNNCRWVTIEVQSNNRRNNHLLTYNGETHTMSEWSSILGIERYILNNRIVAQHWAVERALTTPVKKHKKSQ